MDGQDVVVAVFASPGEAERARDRLIEVGIPANDIRMSAEAADRAGLGETDRIAPQGQQGFWDWLFGRDVPEDDRTWYESNLREGRSVVSVMIRDMAEHHRVADILEEFNPIDFDDTESRYRGIERPTPSEAAGGAWTRPEMAPGMRPSTAEPLGAPETWEADRNMASRGSVAGLPQAPIAAGERNQTLGTEEQVIPVVKEDLAVGKRVSERRYRIRTYTVETPIERDVTLRDERVIIERRPVSDQTAAGVARDMPRDREYEVIERHEEPVVEKRREVEEVVVRRETEDRTERVRDTVRETRVDVDKDADVGAGGIERPLPENRKP